MSSLFNQPLANADETLGVIGDRQLVVVQTLHIARLTSHPVAIVPSSFVAVTGRGPRDSNESGKTSFNAAVSLLLGDPEWRVTGGGVSSVAQLLFEPDTAGVSATRYSAADTGFIVGVFAHPDDPISSAHTVWMKLSSTPKYVQVRHCDGIYLVDADDDVERHRRAPGVWKALPAGDLGAHSYVDTLYGHSPRCLAYVASRGKQRSGPSLLKMDTGAFTPEDIGAALVRLTGRSEALEFEQEQRRKLAKQLDDFDQTKGEHEQKWTAEEKIAEGVRMRSGIRAKLDEGEKLWQQHMARGFLDTVGRRATLEEQARQSAEEISTLTERVRRRRVREKELADDMSLHAGAREAENIFKEADGRLANASRSETTVLNQISVLRSRMVTLEERGARASRLDVNTATQLLKDRKAEHTQRTVDLQAKIIAVRDLRLELAQAEEGRSGDAGRSIAILSEVDPPIPAVGLLDTIEVAAGYRDVWEPRLHPWRAAVCVDERFRDDALAALSNRAGAVLIVGNTVGGLPEGITAAPPSAQAFLAELASRFHPVELENVSAEQDSGLGVVVLGGFDDPTTGRVQMVHALQIRVARMKKELAATERADKLAADLETQATENLKAAQAAVEYRQKLVDLEECETQKLPAARGLVERHTAEREEALDKLTEAKTKAQGIETARSEARISCKQAEEELGTARRDSTTTQNALDAANVDYWRSGLPGGESDARLILNWADEPIRYDVQRGLSHPAAPRDPALPAVVRTSDKLAIRANEELNSILDMLGVTRASGEGAPTEDIGEAVRRREQLDDQEGPLSSQDEAGFALLASGLNRWLSQHIERDQLAEDQIDTARQERAKERLFIESNLTVLEASLSNVQDSLEQRVEANLVAISDALDGLNRTAGGYGATLHCEVLRPTAPDDTWTWKVTPAWRRSPGGRMLPYDSATNTAQEKLFSIHLVLAALLASPNPRGRVLILDELGDSLGDEHRRDVLSAVANVASTHGITVLGTCQDAVMPDAAAYCGEILYFCYPSKADALNLPTRMFGFDDNGERVELSAEHLLVGRRSR